MKLLRYIEAMIVSLSSVFAPIHSIMITALILILVDLVTGMMAAHKRGEKITSSGIRRTLSKVVVYEIALCVGFLAEHYMIPDLPIIKMVSSLISVVELKSIYENLDIINGSSLLKSLVDKLGSKNQ